jgi:hypothetical protein
MANPGNAVSTLNGLFKERYADKVKDLVPDHVKLYNAIKFDTSKKVGKSYNEPVVLSLESGFTYAGEAGNLFDLADVKEFKMQNAEIKARELVLRSAISIGALQRSGSEPQAIQKAMDLMVGNMLKSMYHRLEVQMFYGQTGLGIVDSVALSGTDTVISIKEHEWASGIWNGTTGAALNIYDSSAGAVLATSQVPNKYIIKGYSLADRSVTIAGDHVAALDDGDILYFDTAISATASKNEFLGIHGIAKESVSLFGVSNASEPLFQGSTQNVGTDATTNAAVLSFAKIEEGIAKMVEKGLMEEQVSCYVNPKQWSSLLTEQDAKRSYDSSYSSAKVETGSREIVFHGQNGMIKVIASTFVKEGYAYLICEKDLKRIGSTEVTFKRPDGEEYLELLEGKHGMEMRAYTDQALFTARPSSICVLQNIKVGPYTA